MNKQQQFFYDNAGYSYDPKIETPEHGRYRCAVALADAETLATAHGYSFEWSIDPDVDSSDFDGENEPYAQWLCTMYNDAGDIVANLGGIDFGPDGEPWGNAYRRVVEAELALENVE